jgi:23S rRNA (cytosine1962-C5)-methyltransferase
MAVPPLHHRILNACVGGVGLEEGDRDLGTIDQVQNRHGQDEAAEEPVGHVDVRDLALDQGTEEDHGIGHPHHGDQDVDRPLELGVFLAAGNTQRQRNSCQHDDQLPAPEGESRQARSKQRRMAGSLDRVVRSCEQGTSAERKNDRVRMQRTQTPVAQPFDHVQFRPDQLGGDDDADQHADDAPDYGHHSELAHDFVVVSRLRLHDGFTSL